MTGRERFEMVRAAWDRGATVTFATAYRVTPVSARNARSWDAAGVPFARVSKSGALQIQERRRYVDAMGCAIRVTP